MYTKASSAVHSDLDVGFESAKTIGNCKTYPTQRVICDLVTSGEYSNRMLGEDCPINATNRKSNVQFSHPGMQTILPVLPW